MKKSDVNPGDEVEIDGVAYVIKEIMIDKEQPNEIILVNKEQYLSKVKL